MARSVALGVPAVLGGRFHRRASQREQAADLCRLVLIKCDISQTQLFQGRDGANGSHGSPGCRLDQLDQPAPVQDQLLQ